jgi:hypothetical protein
LPRHEQNELQEADHGASFVGSMLYRCLIGITLLLTSSTTAQVSGDVSDLQAGLVAKWDEVMPLDIEKTLRLPTEAEGMKLEDFAVVFAFQVEKEPDMHHGSHILALINESQSGLLDWNLGTKGFSITLEGRGFGHPVSVSQPMEGRWWQVLLNVKRDARQALSGIWVNGVEMNSWREVPGPIVLTKALFDPCSRGLGGQIANLRLYNRALTRPEILELASMAPMAGLQTKLEPFIGSMKLMTQEVVTVLGGTEAVAMMEEGTMEALMLTQFPGSRVKVRSLAWEADTVFRQDRPMNFGGLKQQLVRSAATVAMLMFGRQECLERGEAGLTEFRAALEKLVKLCAEVTPRLVLLEPPAGTAQRDAEEVCGGDGGGREGTWGVVCDTGWRFETRIDARWPESDFHRCDAAWNECGEALGRRFESAGCAAEDADR